MWGTHRLISILTWWGKHRLTYRSSDTLLAANDANNPFMHVPNSSAILEYLRCLDKLYMWADLHAVVQSVWHTLDPGILRKVAPIACATAVHTGSWDAIRMYADDIYENDLKYLYKAITCVHDGTCV